METLVSRVRSMPVEKEVIAVNDGSQDASGAILDRLKAPEPSRRTAAPPPAHRGAQGRCGARVPVSWGRWPSPIFLPFRGESLPDPAVAHFHESEPDGHGDLLQARESTSDEVAGPHLRSIRLRARGHGAAGTSRSADLGTAHLPLRPHLHRGEKDRVAGWSRGNFPYPPVQPHRSESEEDVCRKGGLTSRVAHQFLFSRSASGQCLMIGDVRYS